MGKRGQRGVARDCYIVHNAISCYHGRGKVLRLGGVTRGHTRSLVPRSRLRLVTVIADVLGCVDVDVKSHVI